MYIFCLLASIYLLSQIYNKNGAKFHLISLGKNIILLILQI